MAATSAVSLAMERLEPVNGLAKVVHWVKDHGYKRAAVTNAPRINAELMLKLLGLTDFFQAVIVGGECEQPKPAPFPYLKALKELDVSAAHTFIFEDSASGTRAGVAAGMPVVAVLTRNPENSLQEAGASLIVKDYADPKLWSALEEIDAAKAKLKGGAALAAHSEEHGENNGKQRRGCAVPVAAAGGGAVRHRRHHVRVGPVPPPRLLGAAAGPGLQRRRPHHAGVRDDAHGGAQQRADRALPVPGLAAGPPGRLLRREGGPVRAVRARGPPGGGRAGGAVRLGAGPRPPARRGDQRAQAQRRAHDRHPRAVGVFRGGGVRGGVRRGEGQAGARRVPPRAGAARLGARPRRGVRGLRDWDPGRRGRGHAGGGDRGRGQGGEGRGRRRVARRQGLPRRQALGGAGRCCCCRRRSRGGGWWGTERGPGACRSSGELS